MSIMDPAYVYLPDDEPDDTLQFNGSRYTLQPNTTTEIVAWTKKLEDDRANGRLPTGKLVAPPGIAPLVMAKHFQETHRKWGVCVLTHPATSGSGKKGRGETLTDQQRIDVAETLYRQSTKEWAEGILLREGAVNAQRKAAGLKEEHSEDGEKAKRWLSAHS